MSYSKSKIILGSGIGIILIIVLTYLAVFGRALSQKEDHVGIALALPKVLFGSKAVPIDEKIYLTKDQESFLKEMERQGFRFKDQYGAGLIFEKNGKRYFSSTRMYSSYFMIFTYPQASEAAQNEQTSVAETVTAQNDGIRYRDLFQRDSKPEWINIKIDGFSISIPYSKEWRFSEVGLAEYQVDSPTDSIKNIRFGRPEDNGTYASREYFIYRTPQIPLDLSYTPSESMMDLKDNLSCVDGFEAKSVAVGSIPGIEHHIGGAKGCSVGFAFNVGQHTYYFYHVPDMGDAPSGVTDEMKRIIQSIKE